MADDIFTDEELKAEQTAATDPPLEETAEQKAERERDEHGRFKAKEASGDGQQAEDEGEDGRSKTVPQGALHAEREKRKAAEAELGKIREQLGALAKMREQVASRKPAELPAADDPAAIEHLRTRLSEIEGNTTRLSQHLDNQAINNAEMEQLGSVAAQSDARFRADHPDYDAAITHVVNARAQELALYGLSTPQIRQTIAEEATEIVRSAIAQGRDPAELGYEIAKSRGYRPEAQAKPKGGGNTGLAERTLAAIAEARKQGKSLGGSGGAAPKSLNAEAVLAMGPEEFDALYSTPEGKRMIDAL